MYKVTGIVKKGRNAGHDTFTRQLKLIAPRFPELARDGVRGTINLELDHDLILLNPHFTSGPITWEPGHIETFDFLRIGLEAPKGTQPIDGWIYVAHDSHHRRNMNTHEIITTGTCNILENNECILHLIENFRIIKFKQARPLIII